MANVDEAALRADATLRKAHYGPGEQPWDVIVRLGWAPQFAAANVLKYLRRTKDVAHSQQSARWYFERLERMAKHDNDALAAITALRKELIKDELKVVL